jgi:ABC-2 type transport system ATP-binding protein
MATLNDTTVNDSTVIQVEGLKKNFGDLQAVDGISFAIEKGEVFGLLGPNGAGKTTTMEIITGLQRESGGKIRVLGRNPAKDGSWLKQKVGVQLQIVHLFPRLTVQETLALFASFYDSPGDVNAVIEMLQLDQKRNDKIMNLSGGQLKRVAVGNAIVGNTDVLFLDEPTAGLDPQTKQTLWSVIKTLKEEGRTVFLTTHSMEEAQSLCDRVCILDHGKIIDMDKPYGLIKKHFKETAIELGSPVGELKDDIMKCDGVSRVNVTENSTTIYSTDVPTAISRLMSLYRGNEDALTNIKIRESNLEDVFLKLTGRRIRE